MFHYTAYGFTLSSELFLPELMPQPDQSIEADVTIRAGQLTPPPLQETESRCLCHVTPEEAYLVWEGAGTFCIRQGKEIIVDVQPGASDRIVRLFLLGAGLGMLLHQRGCMTLHGSTVVIQGNALVFVGDRGYGKSTTTAALLNRGHRLLADDVTALDGTTDAPLVLPGYPQVKLWSDAAVTLGHSLETMPRVHPDFDKHAHRCLQEFSQTVVPLQAIYVLGFGEELKIVPVTMPVALSAVMRNWYCARFGAQMLAVVGHAAHFQRCADLVRRVPVWMLQRPMDLTRLDDVVQHVEHHFLQQISPAVSIPTPFSRLVEPSC